MGRVDRPISDNTGKTKHVFGVSAFPNKNAVFNVFQRWQEDEENLIEHKINEGLRRLQRDFTVFELTVTHTRCCANHSLIPKRGA